VMVKLNSNRGLIVSGTLRAIGDPTHPIVFTSFREGSGTPTPGNWSQVSFGAASVNDTLMSCDFRYAGYNNVPSVSVNGSSPAFTSCRIYSGANLGVSLTGGAHPLLHDCQIFSNGSAAIRTDVASMPVWEGHYGISALHDNYIGSDQFNGIWVSGA